jgi:hypothetical protein
MRVRMMIYYKMLKIDSSSQQKLYSDIVISEPLYL